jgi:hypothetical protein
LAVHVGLLPIVSGAEIRIHLDGLAALLYGVVGKMCDEQKLRQIGVDDERQRIQILRSAHFGESFGVVTEQGQVPGIPVVRGGVAGVQFNSALKFLFGGGEIPVEAFEDKRQRGVCFA